MNDSLLELVEGRDGRRGRGAFKSIDKDSLKKPAEIEKTIKSGIASGIDLFKDLFPIFGLSQFRKNGLPFLLGIEDKSMTSLTAPRPPYRLAIKWESA